MKIGDCVLVRSAWDGVVVCIVVEGIEFIGKSYTTRHDLADKLAIKLSKRFRLPIKKYQYKIQPKKWKRIES